MHLIHLLAAFCPIPSRSTETWKKLFTWGPRAPSLQLSGLVILNTVWCRNQSGT